LVTPVDNQNDRHAEELTLQEVCLLVQMPWHRAYARMTAGAFGTPRKTTRGWIIPRSGVEAYLARGEPDGQRRGRPATL
jgi:hypothetical protein